MQYAPLLRKLSLDTDLECSCPEGTLTIQSDVQERIVRCRFSNKATLRYAFRTFPDFGPSAFEELQATLNAAEMGLRLQVNDTEVLLLRPNEEPRLKRFFLATQYLRARIGR